MGCVPGTGQLLKPWNHHCLVHHGFLSKPPKPSFAKTACPQKEHGAVCDLGIVNYLKLVVSVVSK